MTTSTGTTDKPTYTAKQRKLIEKHRYWNVEHINWWDCTYDDFVEYAAKRGFDTMPKSISFSGFWSQGDGASFTGLIDVPKFIIHHELGAAYPWIMKLFEHGGCIYAKVERISHRYAHENTCQVDLSDFDGFTAVIDAKGDDTRFAVLEQWDAQLQSDIDQLMKDLESTRIDLCQHLYEQLEAEYDYLTSDDAVWEAIEANELDNQEGDDDQ
jgi:hypothetical protein